MYFTKFCLILIHYVFPVISDDSPAWAHLPTGDECGVTRFDKLHNRIIDGNNADLGQFPWMARLSPWFPPYFPCAGALLNRYYILTVAHCRNVNLARLGENHALTEIDCEEGTCAPPYQDIKVKNQIYHNFSSDTLENDISLVLLKEPVKYNEFVVPVCLPRGEILERNFMGSSVTVAGWGITDNDNPDFSPKLFYSVLPIIDNEKCQSRYTQPIMSSQYCIGYDKGSDTCGGDSGGPVTKSLKVDGNRRVYILGIISYGLPICGKAPAVYTKVIYFLDWILKHIEKS